MNMIVLIDLIDPKVLHIPPCKKVVVAGVYPQLSGQWG